MNVTLVTNGFLDVTYNSSEPLIFSYDEVLGLVDLRSLRNYKVKQSIIQHHVKPKFKSL